MSGRRLFTTQGLEPGEFHAGQGHTYLRLPDGRVRHRWPDGEMIYSEEKWTEIQSALTPELHGAIEVVNS